MDMTGENAIFAYYQAIKDGSVTVGRWVRTIYQMIVDGLEQKRWCFDQKKASAAIDWIEKHCFHIEGKLATTPLKLELWQRAFISVIFGIVDDSGLRVFREIFLVIGRKNGKSLLSAAILDYIFRQEGGYGTKCYVVAPKLDQANIVYNAAWQMITLDPEWQAEEELKAERDEHNKKIHDDSLHAKHRQGELSIPGLNCTVKKLAMDKKRNDGFNPSISVLDEIASWEGDKGLKVFEVMTSGTGARDEPLTIACTTAGYVNDSIFDELMMRSTRFLKGDSKESRLFPVLYMIDDPEKWNDISELQKANPNLGTSVSVSYIVEQIAIAEGSISKKREFLCKHCCVKQNSSLAWLDAELVRRATGEHITPEMLQDSYAVLGIDLSQTTDLTAAVCVVERSGKLKVLAHFWLPGEKIDEASQRDGVPYQTYIDRGFLSPSGENYVNYNDVFNWIMELIRDYQILPLVIGYDRWSARALIDNLQAEGATCDDVWQGENLYGVIQETEAMLKDGKIDIGDNDLLKIHLLDSAIKMSTERGRGRLVKVRQAACHIDGCAALLDAMCVRQKWWSQIGEQLQNVG